MPVRKLINSWFSNLRAHTLLKLFGFCLPAIFASTLQAEPSVVVSIKPLQHIVAAITTGVAEPQVLVDGDQDPHNIALRPSQRRLLANADLLVWVGPILELPLEDLLGQIDADIFTLSEVAGLKLIFIEGELDPHIWLDTNNVSLIAEALTQRLQGLDAANQSSYQQNLINFQQRLAKTEKQIRGEFSQQPASSWAVYHHAFRYFEAQFSLPPALLLKSSENNEPGLRSVMSFVSAMEEEGLNCVVLEPGVNPERVRALLNKPALEVQSADLFGLTLVPNAQSYSQLVLALASAIQNCSGGIHE